MPLKLIPPKPGRSSFYRVRGTFHSVYLDQTTETKDKVEARKILRGWEKQILSGVISGREELTFMEAANAYISAGGEGRFLERIIRYFGAKLAAGDINQNLIDQCAAILFHSASPATRNRQVYSPISAVLRHVHINTIIRRPKGAAGNQRTRFFTIEEFDRLEAETAKHNPELAAFFTLLAYTGLRLSEALRIKRAELDLQRREVICGKTKNGDPRAVHLPVRVVVALANCEGSPRHDRLFPWSKCGAFYAMLDDAYEFAGVDPEGAPNHVLRHTYGAWMARLGVDLVDTGAWRSRSAARVYQHFIVSEEAAKADLLPGARRTK